jgi:hypothetical protein
MKRNEVTKEKLTNYIEKRPPSEINSQSASQEIPCPLWKQMVHYRVHNSPPPVSMLSQMHAVHTFPPYFTNVHSNTFLSMPRSSQLTLPFNFRTKILYAERKRKKQNKEV